MDTDITTPFSLGTSEKASTSEALRFRVVGNIRQSAGRQDLENRNLGIRSHLFALMSIRVMKIGQRENQACAQSQCNAARERSNRHSALRWILVVQEALALSLCCVRRGNIRFSQSRLSTGGARSPESLGRKSRGYFIVLKDDTKPGSSFRPRAHSGRPYGLNYSLFL